MLSVIMLSVIMLSVIMLSVMVLNQLFLSPLKSTLPISILLWVIQKFFQWSAFSSKRLFIETAFHRMANRALWLHEKLGYVKF